MSDEVRSTLIVTIGVVLVLSGVTACIAQSATACEQTRRAALQSDEPARVLVLAKACF